MMFLSCPKSHPLIIIIGNDTSKFQEKICANHNNKQHKTILVVLKEIFWDAIGVATFITSAQIVGLVNVIFFIP